jgi:hypothetical protein
LNLTAKMKAAVEILHGSPKEQSDMTGVDRRTLDALERAGFVRKAAGRRVAVWSLTPAGVELRDTF